MTAGHSRVVVGGSMLAALVAVAVAAPVLAPFDPAERVADAFLRPGWPHLLGTDDVGHDILSQLVHGTRVSLLVGVAAALAATLVGTAVGLVAGYRGGWVDTVAMRLVDVVLSVPFLPLMIVIGVVLGPGVGTEVLVIAAVMWAGPARELRAQVLSVRSREHVRCARVMGAGTWWVVTRHLAPATAPLVAAQFVTATRRAILFEAALAFLGLGPAGVGSWGRMLFSANARNAFLTDAWLWWVVPPGLAIAAAVLAFALLGQGLEERARPRLAAGSGGARPSRAHVQDHGATAGAILEVRGLTVVHDTDGGPVTAVEGLDLTVPAGGSVGLVGASGAGKTTAALACLGLLAPGARVTAGRVRYGTSGAGRDLLGDRVGFVPQQAMDALNPVLRVGDQLTEAIRLHRDVRPAAARDQAGALLEEVGLGATHLGDHPHQLSGGMRQRVVLAMALANGPQVLVADEPTTGLDVIRQAELVALLERLRAERGLALLVISHDLPVVLRLTDDLVVVRDGRVVETGPADRLRIRARRDYTRALLHARPGLGSGEAVS